MKKTVLKPLLFILLASFAFPQQALVSTELHGGAVVAVNPLASGDSFFTAGEDGFLTKWSGDDIGERFQVTDTKISIVSSNPANSDVAVASTDGGSVHKVDVIDWSTMERKFSKQFKEPVLSLSYSSKGHFLFVNTTEVQGNYVFNAVNGKLIKKIDQISTRISLVQTSESEKTAIFYCPAKGQFLYYNLAKLTLTNTKFNTEPNLEQVRMFGVGEKSKNRFLAGVKNKMLYITDAQTGKTLYSSTLGTVVIVDSLDKGGLYYAVAGKTVNLYKITEESILKKLDDPKSIVSPVNMANLYDVSPKFLSSLGTKNGQGFVVGYNDGNVLRLSKNESSYESKKMTKKMYNRILDIASMGDDSYILVSDGLYKTSYDQKDIVLVGKNSGHTNVTMVDDSTAVLWSKRSKKAVQKISLSGSSVSSPVAIFTPVDGIVSLRCFQRNIVYTMDNSKVERFNIDNGKKVSLYAGTGVNDAIFLSNDSLYMAKAASSSVDSPLVLKSISTGETASLKVNGSVAFSLDYDDDENNGVYGIAVNDSDGLGVTQIFKYYPAEKRSVELLKFNQEDQEAFIQLEGNILYTNLGKNQVYSYDLESGKVRVYRRTTALPKKISFANERLVFLNDDGGISWYNPLSQSPMAQWYLSLDGNWVEF